MIYYFHDERIPLLALDMYAKNERTDLEPDEIKRLRNVVASIVNSFLSRSQK